MFTDNNRIDVICTDIDRKKGTQEARQLSILAELEKLCTLSEEESSDTTA